MNQAIIHGAAITAVSLRIDLCQITVTVGKNGSIQRLAVDGGIKLSPIIITVESANRIDGSKRKKKCHNGSIAAEKLIADTGNRNGFLLPAVEIRSEDASDGLTALGDGLR